MKAPRKAMSEAARALWFFELEKAIDEAQWLAWRIGVVEGRNAQALELYVQLEMVRAEVEALRGHKITRVYDSPAEQAFPERGEAPDDSLDQALDALRNLSSPGEGLQE
ncbi:MAG TPA: hypothetical protein VFK58_00990 [Sphingomicrobium sp.]|nr:hypothetical protein [Sphingomicrobium sp.]